MSRRVRPEAAQPTFASLLVAPVYYVLNLAWTTVMRAIPLLFPVAAVLLLVPALALLSLGAGWMVWSSVPTGWRAPLDFQYGCAVVGCGLAFGCSPAHFARAPSRRTVMASPTQTHYFRRSSQTRPMRSRCTWSYQHPRPTLR